MQIPKPPYRAQNTGNYSFNDTFNELIAQNKAEKIARDLQNQKLNQELIQETTRKSMELKQNELLHMQKKELTLDQQKDLQVDRDYHQKLTESAAKVKMDYEKYLLATERKNSIENFYRESNFEKDKMSIQFHNDLSKMQFKTTQDIRLLDRSAQIDFEKNKQDHGFKTDILKLVKDQAIEKYEALKQIDEDFFNSAADYSYARDKWEFQDRKTWDPDVQMQMKKNKVMMKMMDDEIQNQATTKELTNHIGSWSSKLSAGGFVPGQWDSNGTAAVINLLQEQFPIVQKYLNTDPMGLKNPQVYASLQQNVLELDSILRQSGRGSGISVFGWWGKKSKQDVLKINQMMKQLKYMLNMNSANSQQQPTQ